MINDNSWKTSLRESLNLREEEYLSPLAAKSGNASRRRFEKRTSGDYRQSFSLDADRIVNSRAYSRYIDKTQVFSFIKNDHLTHRVLHVQLVSKCARTIGRFLGLNEDLIEAICLGHDIGHTPFGHDGEQYLSELCLSHSIGAFEHNVQSVQLLDRVERKGRGLNLCIETLDGILCHDGPEFGVLLKPDRTKTFETLDKDLLEAKNDKSKILVPMSLEGCVTRLADVISYIARDFEDAIRIGILKREALPEKVVKILGTSNGTIVYNLVTDVIENSFRQPFVGFSDEVSEAILELKNFNMVHIYKNPLIKKHLGNVRELFHILFDRYLGDLKRGDTSSVIFTSFLKDMTEDYISSHKQPEIVRDFISGMTDQYFISECPEQLRPAVITGFGTDV